ncbi:hypothetical protein FRC11_001656, partial [Ceratobasidium sp. 423]
MAPCTSFQTISKWPKRRMMIDTGITALNTPENIATREPTEYELDWISPKDAEARWGKRVWVVPDFTISAIPIFVYVPRSLLWVLTDMAPVIKGKWWWEPLRRRVLKMSSVDQAIQDLSLWWYGSEADVARLSEKLEGGKPTEDHDGLVAALKELVEQKSALLPSPENRPWDLEIVEAEHISREEQ